MATQNVTVAVAAATLDAMNEVADLVSTVKKAMADGWSPGTDIPAIVVAAVHDLGKVVGELGEVKNEYDGDKAPFTAALAIGGSAVAAAVLG